MAQALEDQLIWLLERARSMLRTRSIDTLLKDLCSAYASLTGAGRVEIFFRERGSQVPRFKRGLEGADSYREGSRLDTLAKKALDARAPRSADGGFAWPLISQADLVGVVALSPQAGQSLKDAPELLTEHLAALAANAIENARHFERAQTDPLTGLPNSTHFLLQLGKALKACDKSENVGVLLLDLDNFKRVNNRAGAEMGDQALIDIASTLQERLRADGLLARYGSDKFALLLPPDAERADLRLYDAAERAGAAIRAKVYHDIAMSCCIGGASFPSFDAETAADLVAFADDALARARSRGSGEVEIESA